MKRNFFKQPFKEQIEYFKKKTPVPQASFKDLPEGYHDFSFSVAGLTRADLLHDLQLLVQKHIEEGESLEDFQKKFDRLIGRRGWRPTPEAESKEYARRVRTIIETNQRQSYRAGRYEQVEKLSPRSPNNFIVWIHGDSPDYRPRHKELHMKALPKDHPFWKTCLPPCGYGCKCRFSVLPESLLEQRGYEILKDIPDPEEIADPSCRRIPG